MSYDSAVHIVLLPGLDGTGKLFRPLLEVLPPELIPIVVSYPTDRVRSYGELIPLVQAVLPSSDSFLLLGESFGGPLALKVAAAGHPRLRGVILCATFVADPLPPWFGWIKWLPMSWLREILKLDAPDFLVRCFAAGWDAPRDLLDLFRQAKRQVAPEVLAARVRAAVEVNATEALVAVRLPMLYLHPTCDRLISRRCVADIVTHRYDAQVPQFDSPHLLLQRCPKEAARMIARFVATVTNGRSSSSA